MNPTSRLRLVSLCVLLATTASLFAGNSAASGDQPARAISKIAPKYPYPTDRYESAPEGSVVISFVIGEDGNVWMAQVDHSTNVALERAALDALKKWKFAPALRDGRPTTVRAIQEFAFRLETGTGRESTQIAKN